MFDKSKFETTKVEGVANVTYSDDKAFFTGTEIPKDDIVRVFKYAAEYINEGTKAAKEVSEAIMKKDKSVDKAVVSMPYSTSKRGGLEVEVKRSHTYPGMNGGDPVTKSTMKVKVTDPATKVPKSSIKAMEAELTTTICN